MKFVLISPSNSPSLLRKLAGLLVTVAVVGLVLMFSAVVFAVIAIVGAIAWAYLWWKSRELRKQMRDFASWATVREQQAGDADVFEGEVIRVVEPRDVMQFDKD